MENLLKWLPDRPQPIWLRYGVTILFVLASFGLMRLVEKQTGVSCFFVMYPAVFLAAVMFDRGSGLLAAGSAPPCWSFPRKKGPRAFFPSIIGCRSRCSC